MVIENKKGKVDDDSAVALATKYNDPSGLLFLSNDEYDQLKTFAKVTSDTTETVDQKLEDLSDISEQGADVLLNFMQEDNAPNGITKDSTKPTLTNVGDDFTQASDIDPADSIGGDTLSGMLDILSGNSATETTDTTHMKGC